HRRGRRGRRPARPGRRPRPGPGRRAPPAPGRTAPGPARPRAARRAGPPARARLPRRRRRSRRAGRPARRPCSEVDRGGQRLGLGVDLGADPELLLDPLLDLVGEAGVVAQELAGVLLALPELVALVGVPGAGLADDPLLDADVDERALAADAHAVEDVELGLLERRRDLVLDDLDAGAVADHVGTVLERLDAADVQPDRRVELQRAPTGGGLRRAEHHADLLAQLVDEDRRGARAAQR